MSGRRKFLFALLAKECRTFPGNPCVFDFTPLPPPLPPPPFFFFPPTSNVCLCALPRANGDHVFTTRSMISPRLETMHRVGELELCKGVSIGRRIDRFLSSILLYAHPTIDVHHENQDRRYFM